MPVGFIEIGALIARDPALRGGRPVIAGTGIRVRTIAIESNQGLSPEDIAAEEQAYDEGVRASPLPLRS